jgi:PAS domain S-box-containing protein
LLTVKSGEAQRWLAAIVESSDDAIIGKRLDGTIVSWNSGATRMLGYSAEEMIGQSVLKLFPPELMDEEPAIVAQLVRGERVNHFETARLRKDGTRVEISLSVSPILDAGGAIVGAAKLARDITEAKRAREAMRLLNRQLEDQATELEEQAGELEEQASELEHQLEESTTLAAKLEESNAKLQNAVAEARRATEEAQTASRVKSEFLATMSHELRTPLNAISGYADLMDAGIHGQLPPEYRDYLERIRKSQRHLLDLISGLLDFSKLEAGKLEVSVSPVSVSDLFARLEPLVEPQARAKNQALRLERPEDGVRVQADPDRAVQILLNLVANAIKFTPVEGRITVTSTPNRASAVVVRVRDTGPGIGSGDAERIFAPFVQGDKSLTRDHQGAGLGLAISRDLARAMGGDVVLEQGDGHGATFALTLKRAE